MELLLIFHLFSPLIEKFSGKLAQNFGSLLCEQVQSWYNFEDKNLQVENYYFTATY